MTTLTAFTEAPITAAPFGASLRSRSSMMTKLADAVRTAHPASGAEAAIYDEDLANLVWAIWRVISDNTPVPGQHTLTDAATLPIAAPDGEDALPLEAQEVLDWDFVVDEPPSQRKGSFTATLRYAGKEEPLAVEDPWAD
jgi:hypothetical protein